MKTLKILSVISALLLTSACANRSHPKMLSFTPASVVIDYSDNDLHEATALAQQFCASTRKDAQYVRTEEKGLVFTTRNAFFNCVQSDREHHNNGSTNSTIPIINNFK